MEKEIINENIENSTDNINSEIENNGEEIIESSPVQSENLEISADGGVEIEQNESESESEAEKPEEKKQSALSFMDEPPRQYTPYMPRFTDVSEKHRRSGDAKIRERLGITTVVLEGAEHNPDEIKLDPTAEFDEDVNGSEAQLPINSGRDESDETLDVNKNALPEEEETLSEDEKAERDRIKKLLRPVQKSEPKAEPVDDDEETFEEVKPEEITEQIEETETKTEAEEKEYKMPDPDKAEFGVYDFGAEKVDDDRSDLPEGLDSLTPQKEAKLIKEREFSNPTQRDGFKDRFLDSLMSIRIRTGATIFFAILLLVLEVLSAAKVVPFKLFDASNSYAVLGIVDFLLAVCIFLLALPESIKAVKDLASKKLSYDLIHLPALMLMGAYTLTILLTHATSYSLFGLLYAALAIPVLTASLYRMKANFIAFKMISQPEEKQIIDKKNTRELPAENIALDGIIDEYRSKIARTFRTGFVSDFFKNSSRTSEPISGFALTLGIPFGIGVVAGAITYFLTWNPLTAVGVLTLIFMIGCPAFAITARKISFFHTQRAALLCDSTAISEDAYQDFSAVDVFAFDDDDIFGPDDVNLKRFMLYDDGDNIDKVMRQMCALFASVGGPLDYMFSNAIDNRVRHKSATNMVIEDDGICGDVAGHRICAGSEDYMRRNGIAIPAAAVAPEKGVSLDTIKVMYAAEDGEVCAKFYIRYSFSEEFSMVLPSLREEGIIPLVYTRDPNITSELIDTLTAGTGALRVVKLYKPMKEEQVFTRVSAKMVTYGDKLDAAHMILLSKKYQRFASHVRFAELSSMIVGVVFALILALIGFSRVTILAGVLWQFVWCIGLRLFSKMIFLRDANRQSEEVEN